jgi:hypothetical protein
MIRFATAWILVVTACGAMTSPALATDPRANDGGLNDLVIYLGSDHPNGVPNVEFRKITTDLANLKIEIPPAVHVHRYYYNGNKEFQGPLVVGGPTVVVANHPRTNERMYIEAQLPAGYPSIAYDEDSITYIYPESRVVIGFKPLHAEKFRVTYLGGRGSGRSLHEFGRALSDRAEARREASGIRQSFQTVRQNVRNTTRGIVATTGTVVGQGAQVVGQAVTVIPGVRSLRSRGEQVEAARTAARDRIGNERLPTEALDFLPTIR